MSPQPDRPAVVLVVDDTPANLGVLFDLLGRAGFDVLIAEDGESAVEATLSRVDAAGGPLVTIILRDIGERRRAEAERRELAGLNRYLEDEVRAAVGAGDLVGTSPALRRVIQAVDRVAPTDSTVLILGETGTGKELIARALHKGSGRAAKALVKVNCAAIPSRQYTSPRAGRDRTRRADTHREGNPARRNTGTRAQGRADCGRRAASAT